MRTQVTTRPRRGLSLRESATLRPGTYSFAVGEDEPVVTVRADNAVIDCTGVTLSGTESSSEARRGVGIRIINSRKVRVVGLQTVGFQVGVHVLHSEDVVVEDVSATRTRLKPTNADDPDDPVNWIDLFDKAGWRLYGTGIWYERCRGGVVRRCITTGAQNGITLDKTDEAAVLGCDCSQNAGWGVHLDRARQCQVVNNLCADCARPGEEVQAAGIALNNGCHGNEVVSNEMPRCTHGIILTARYNEQSNGNLIASNDVSESSHSAIQCMYCDDTRVLANHVRQARHGLYLGHLRGAAVEGNHIYRCGGAGILIDHGAQVAVRENSVEGCAVGIAQRGQTGHSRPPTDCRIEDNVLQSNSTGIRLEAGRRTHVSGNYDAGNHALLHVSEDCVGTEAT